MKTLSLFLASVVASSAFAYAKPSVQSIIMIDEKTEEVCQMNVAEGVKSEIKACTEDEKVIIADLDAVEKNPQFAALGAAIQGLVSYYMICSAIQFSPKLLSELDKATDNRSVGEKIKDSIYSSEERKFKNDLKHSVEKAAEVVTGTLCLPVGALNKQLIYLYEKN